MGHLQRSFTEIQAGNVLLQSIYWIIALYFKVYYVIHYVYIRYCTVSTTIHALKQEFHDTKLVLKIKWILYGLETEERKFSF